MIYDPNRWGKEWFPDLTEQQIQQMLSRKLRVWRLAFILAVALLAALLIVQILLIT